MAPTCWLLFIIATASLTVPRPSQAGMSDYGDAVMQIEMYERIAVVRDRSPGFEALLAYNRNKAQAFLAGRPDDAIRHLERAQTLDRRNALAAANLAYAYLDKAMVDRARGAYETFLRRLGKVPASLKFKTFDDLLLAYTPLPTETP